MPVRQVAREYRVYHVHSGMGCNSLYETALQFYFEQLRQGTRDRVTLRQIADPGPFERNPIALEICRAVVINVSHLSPGCLNICRTLSAIHQHNPEIAIYIYSNPNTIAMRIYRNRSFSLISAFQALDLDFYARYWESRGWDINAIN